MIRFAPALLLSMALIGCAPMPGEEAGVRCNADRVQALVGREFKPAMEERARLRSGARTVRVIRPGDMVTKDFRIDRLNLELDDVGTVKAARCG